MKNSIWFVVFEVFNQKHVNCRYEAEQNARKWLDQKINWSQASEIIRRRWGWLSIFQILIFEVSPFQMVFASRSQEIFRFKMKSFSSSAFARIFISFVNVLLRLICWTDSSKAISLQNGTIHYDWRLNAKRFQF